MVLAGLLALEIAASPSPAPVDAHALFSAAVVAMSDLPQPSYVTYRMVGENDGMQVGLTVIDGNLWLSIGKGPDSSSWSVQHRTFDYKSIVSDDEEGTQYTTVRSFFDPTWYGTERALRLGMLNSQDAAPPRHTQEDPTPPPGPVLRTIAVATVMSPSIYNVEDRGPAACANGAAGRALHVWSKARNVMHQLSDVTVDLSSMRFCMMRYSIADTFGYHGIVEQHFASVGGYWMQTDGLLDGTVRFMGFSMHHGIWRYRLADMRFPATLSI